MGENLGIKGLAVSDVADRLRKMRTESGVDQP